MGNRRCMITRPCWRGGCGGLPAEPGGVTADNKQGIPSVALSKDDIEYIAHLARLGVADADIPDYQAKLDKIIGFIDELGKADTDAITPMAHPLDMAQRLRADEVTEADDRDRYQQNAEVVANGLYVVPRVVE